MADYTITSADCNGAIGITISANQRTASFTLPNANQWYRISAVFTLNSDATLKPFTTRSSSDGYTYVTCPMLETGEILHDFVPYG